MSNGLMPLEWARALLKEWIDTTDWDDASPEDGQRANAVYALLAAIPTPVVPGLEEGPMDTKPYRNLCDEYACHTWTVKEGAFLQGGAFCDCGNRRWGDHAGPLDDDPPRSVNRSEDAYTRDDLEHDFRSLHDAMLRGPLNGGARHLTLLDRIADAARAGLEATEKYDLLRRAINEYDVDGCTPKCDSYGHAENCRSGDPRAIIENQQLALDAARGVRSTPSDEGPARSGLAPKGGGE